MSSAKPPSTPDTPTSLDDLLARVKAGRTEASLDPKGEAPPWRYGQAKGTAKILGDLVAPLYPDEP